MKTHTNTGESTPQKVVAKVINAGKEYIAGDTKIIALKPSTVELKAGELLLIIGPSGSGKTTLFSSLDVSFTRVTAKSGSMILKSTISVKKNSRN